jgi:pimeloyl-ACP methyl ester carboxylesterase
MRGIARLLIAIGVLLVFVGFTRGAQMNKTYVLVHGAWQAAWAWDHVRSKLGAQGAEVIVVNLPSHGDDQTPVTAVTLNMYRDAVVSAIGDRKDVILVGHSFGGTVISTVAEAIPQRIAKLVFVAAFMPLNGETSLALSGAEANKTSLLGSNLVFDDAKNPTKVGVTEANLVDIYCADCSAADKALVFERRKAEALGPLATPVTLTQKNYGSVPRYYVETLKDKAVAHPFQEWMIGRNPVKKRFQLDSSHSPSLSQPDKLSAILLGL